MLRQLRLFASSFVGGIVILLLALTFVPAGTNQTQGSTNLGSSVVTVEGERFYDIQVQSAANQVLARLGGNLGGNPRNYQQAQSLEGWPQLESAIISQIAGSQVFLNELTRQGWTASEEEIIANIPNDPQFSVAGTYVKSLAENALDTPAKEARYIAVQQQQLNSQRLLEFATNYAPEYVPAAATQTQFDRVNRLYGFDVATVLASGEDVGEPSDEALFTILEENRENYNTQEYRAFSLVLATADAFDGDADALATAVTAMQDMQQNGVEVEGTLDTIEASIEDLAATAGLQVQSFDGIDRFGRYDQNAVEPVARSTLGLAQDLFTLEDPGALSEVRVNDDGSAFVLRLESITDARPLTFDEARDRLESLWRFNAQNNALSERLEGDLAALGDGSLSLVDFAAAENVEVQNLDPVTISQLGNAGIDPTTAATMTVGDTASSVIGSRVVVFQLRELGQQDTDDETGISLEAVQTAVRASLIGSLENGFRLGIESNADIDVNRRELELSLDQAIQTAHNAGYFDGTVTQASYNATLQQLQSAAQAQGGHGG